MRETFSMDVTNGNSNVQSSRVVQRVYFSLVFTLFDKRHEILYTIQASRARVAAMIFITLPPPLDLVLRTCERESGDD